MSSQNRKSEEWQEIKLIFLMCMSLVLVGYIWVRGVQEDAEAKERVNQVPVVNTQLRHDSARKICREAMVSSCEYKPFEDNEVADLDAKNTVYISREGARLFGSCRKDEKCTVKRIMAISNTANEG